jgi:hypothetical protein
MVVYRLSYQTFNMVSLSIAGAHRPHLLLMNRNHFISSGKSINFNSTTINYLETKAFEKTVRLASCIG